MPILSSFVKRALTISNAIPSSEFPTRPIKNLSSIGKSDVHTLAFFVQKPACFEGDFAMFVKECCRKVQKTMFFRPSENPTREKKTFRCRRKTIFHCPRWSRILCRSCECIVAEQKKLPDCFLPRRLT
jgi:hypothetical protein